MSVFMVVRTTWQSICGVVLLLLLVVVVSVGASHFGRGAHVAVGASHFSALALGSSHYSKQVPVVSPLVGASRFAARLPQLGSSRFAIAEPAVGSSRFSNVAPAAASRQFSVVVPAAASRQYGAQSPLAASSHVINTITSPKGALMRHRSNCGLYEGFALSVHGFCVAPRTRTQNIRI